MIVSAFAQRHFYKLVIAIWLLFGAAILSLSQQAIADWKVGDPDDQMRLLQVRDWLAGQSWWDITQYRMNAPQGGDMHWSRLVDVPLGIAISVLTPFVGQALAEQAAAALVPLCTLGVVLLIYAAAARRMFDPATALTATGLVVMIMPFTAQLLPMRIDHHGWQLACFVAILWAVFDDRRRISSAIVLGLSCAFWIEISVEGLPFAALLLGVSALSWIMRSAQGRDHKFPIAITSTAFGTLILFGITESWSSPAYCDALSLFHVAALTVIAGIIVAACLLEHFFGQERVTYVRTGGAIIAAMSGLATLWMMAPQCAGDAFAGLDPLVRTYWFDRGAEGLPLWELSLDQAIMPYAYLFIGLLALVYVLATNQAIAKRDKINLTLLYIGTFCVGIWVSRTAVYAIILGNICVAATIIQMFATAERLQALLPRMAIRMAALAFAMPALWAPVALRYFDIATAQDQKDAKAEDRTFLKQVMACQKASSAAALGRLPASAVMAGLDTSPAILQFTRHNVVATGHHRNQEAMADVIRTFIGSKAEAAAIFSARKIRYLVICDGSYELALYQRNAPTGFLAHLRRGNVPDWLVRQPGIGPFQIYEVQRAALADGLVS